MDMTPHHKYPAIGDVFVDDEDVSGRSSENLQGDLVSVVVPWFLENGYHLSAEMAPLFGELPRLRPFLKEILAKTK